MHRSQFASACAAITKAVSRQITNSGLREHADTIAGKLQDDRTEHADLLARATAAREALAEAELRHLVGEYEPERFEAERTRHTSDIETFDLSLGAVAERIARLEEIHALVSRAPRPAIAEPPQLVFEPDEEIVLDEDQFVAIDDLAPEEESSDILAVFEEASPAADEFANDRPSATPEFGPLSFRPSGAAPSDLARPVVPPSRTPRPMEGTPPLGIPSADAHPRFVRPGERMSASATPAARQAEPAQAMGDVLLRAGRSSATGPAPKETLRKSGGSDASLRRMRCDEPASRMVLREVRGRTDGGIAGCSTSPGRVAGSSSSSCCSCPSARGLR